MASSNTTGSEGKAKEIDTAQYELLEWSIESENELQELVESAEEEEIDFAQCKLLELSKESENERQELVESAEEEEIDVAQCKLLELSKESENERHELEESAERASKLLHILADEIDEFCKKCNRGKIAGSAASLAGFPLIAAGFGLSFVTFGASLGLSIAGAALSGAGGITAASSGLAEHFMTKSKCKAAQEAVNAVHEKAEAYKESIEKLKEMVPSLGVSSAVRHTGSLASKTGSSVGIPVVNGIRLAAGVADDAAGTVFRGLGTGLRVLHIGGFVVSSLLVPVDVYTLTTSSIKEHRKTGSEQANKIRELARKITREVKVFLNPEDIGWLNLFS